MPRKYQYEINTYITCAENDWNLDYDYWNHVEDNGTCRIYENVFILESFNVKGRGRLDTRLISQIGSEVLRIFCHLDI